MKTLAILLPFVLLGIIEMLLRVFNYGYNPALFIQDKIHANCWVMNPDVSKRYFTNQANATIGSHEPFFKNKEPNTFRIFVLGESTTIGYPFLHNGSFHRWLQYRLQLTFPKKRIEIINLSLTAVNSYTIRDFADELKPHQPDLVLIYVGHNEYYGALGVCSTSFLGTNPTLVSLAVKLRQLKVVQFASDLVGMLMSAPSDKNVTLMERLSEKNKVPFGSADYDQGLAQFEKNMYQALFTLKQENIPVFISTIASTEKDLKPFVSENEKKETSADHYYSLANIQYDRHNFQEAKTNYQLARQYDMLRFRAPDSINAIIQKLSKQFNNVTVVDTQKMYELYSPQSILGRELFLEHVHPTLHGYALMSHAFYEKFREQKVIAEHWDNYVAFDSIKVSMPVTIVDSLRGAYEILMLREQWPFNEKITDAIPRTTYEEKIAGALAVKQLSWGAAMLEMVKHYKQSGDDENLLRTMEALALDNPLNEKVLNETAIAAQRVKKYDLAVYYLERTFNLNKRSETASKLFIELLKLDRASEALFYIDYAQAKGSKVDLGPMRTIVNEIVMLKQRLASTSSNVDLMNLIAEKYLLIGNENGARKYLEQVLKIDPNNPYAKAFFKH
jgi:tetratricopeptide (TPR) repeat protein